MTYIGMVIVLAASTSIGIGLSENLSERVRLLKELKKMVILTKGEIRFAATPLPEIFNNISVRFDGIIANFLTNVANTLEKLESKEVTDSWDKAINECLKGSVFKAQDIERIKQVGQTLGYPDKDIQISTLDLCIEQLEEDISKAIQEAASLGKLYRALGALSGIFLIVVLI